MTSISIKCGDRVRASSSACTPSAATRGGEGARLDLGSTAKLRTLITYLELVAALHDRWSGLSPEELAAVAVMAEDALGRWARDHLSRAKDKSLAAMLEAALQRSYSASPAEAFFTGGGAHRFANFDPADNGRVISLREAFQRSVNLVFIRLMRDVVRHVMFNATGANAALLTNATDPARHAYLSRFADEGREFIARFYRKYRGLSQQQAEDLLLKSVRATGPRLASVFGGLEPEAGADRFAAFLKRWLAGARLSERAVRQPYEKYGAGRFLLTTAATLRVCIRSNSGWSDTCVTIPAPRCPTCWTPAPRRGSRRTGGSSGPGTSTRRTCASAPCSSRTLLSRSRVPGKTWATRSNR